jgi:hypothetical protein
MPLERRPLHVLPRDFTPPGSSAYKVTDGDSWATLAERCGLSHAWSLVYFNFQTRSAAETNWYLHHHVGCVKKTRDSLNWIFSADAKPGLIHMPTRVGLPDAGLEPVRVPEAHPKSVSCATGKSTRFRLVNKNTGTLLIYTDLDEGEALLSEDRIILAGSSGYRADRVLREQFVRQDGAVAVVFTEVPMEDTFRLQVAHTEGTTTLCENIAFADLHQVSTALDAHASDAGLP